MSTEIKFRYLFESRGRRKRSLPKQIQHLFGKVGSLYAERFNFRLTADVKAKFTNKVKNDPRSFSAHTFKQV